MLPPILVPSSEPVVAFEVAVRTDVAPREEGALALLAEALPRETSDFSAKQIRIIVSGSGEAVRSRVGPDALRLGFRVPAPDASLGFSLLSSYLRRGMPTPAQVEAARARLSARSPEGWAAVLRGSVPDLNRVKAEDVQRLYRRLFQPSNLTVAVGGTVSPALVQREWQRRFDDWQPELRPVPPVLGGGLPQPGRTGGDFIGLVLSASLPTADDSVPTGLLSAALLGLGKSSTLFQVLREREGWSYRQEAFLAPTLSGWALHLALARVTDEEGVQLKERVLAALTDAVGRWTEDDRSRALAMLEACLKRDLRLLPLYPLGSEPLGHGIGDRTFIRAYWRMKTGAAWNEDTMLERLRGVTLEQAKKMTLDRLDAASLRVVPR